MGHPVLATPYIILTVFSLLLLYFFIFIYVTGILACWDKNRYWLVYLCFVQLNIINFQIKCHIWKLYFVKLDSLKTWKVFCKKDTNETRVKISMFEVFITDVKRKQVVIMENKFVAMFIKIKNTTQFYAILSA